MVHVTSGFPAGGADMAPLLVAPNGQVDLVYEQHKVTNRKDFSLGPAHLYFSDSTDGGAHWRKGILLGPASRTSSDAEWWIDGDLSIDSGGILYATWDTQGAEDVGWLTWSTDHGQRWSTPIRVTPDHDKAVHIVEVAGTSAGVADVGWLSDSSGRGFALYLRPFSIAKGWLAGITRPSAQLFGAEAVWPGDTFGIATPVTPGAAPATQHVELTWGSSLHHGRGDIFATTATLPG